MLDLSYIIQDMTTETKTERTEETDLTDLMVSLLC